MQCGGSSGCRRKCFDLRWRTSIKSLLLPRSCIGLITVATLLASESSFGGAILDYIRDYDLNDYSLGISVASSQSPYVGAPNSVIAYPYLTSFRHSAFTDDWLLIRGENVGFRYINKSDWEFGLIGRVQTLGFGGTETDELRGLDARRWSLEVGPIVGYRGLPVHMQARSYWEVLDRHSGTTSEIEFSLPRQFARGHIVPSVKFSYLSDRYSRYYFGVADYEATTTRPAYEPGSAVNIWAGLSLGYTLTPKWLLSTTVGVEFLDDAISASPIVARERQLSVSVGLAYNTDLFEPAVSDSSDEDRFEIRLGAARSASETKVRRDAENGTPGEIVDLEEVLGIADRETVYYFDSVFRLARFHRLELSYFDLQRRSPKILEQDVQFGEQEFLAGTEVETTMSSEVARFAYSYSLMRDEQKEVGVSAGLSYSRLETRMVATATQEAELQAVDALVPTIGIFGSVALGAQSRLSVDINAFALDFDQFDGYTAFINVGLDRKFSEHLAAGLGYSFYGLRLKSQDDSLRGSLSLRHYGPKLYLSAFF